MMTVEEKRLRAVVASFEFEGEFRHYELIESGHINTTYKVFVERHGELKDYIVQRLNTYVFKNPEAVMKNIAGVTEFIRAKIKATGVSAKRYVLHYAKTAEGQYYTILPDGGFWRCCRFIDGSKSFLFPETERIVEESGKAFGEFQRHLSDYPVKDLEIVIPHFHNTVMRYETFKQSVQANTAKRRVWVEEEIEGYLALEEIATRLYKMQRKGELPLRVTHNDT